MLRHTKPGKIVTKAPGSHIWRHIHLTSRNFSCFRPLQRRLVLPRTFVTRPETDDTHTRVHVDDNSWIGLTDSSDYRSLTGTGFPTASSTRELVSFSRLSVSRRYLEISCFALLLSLPCSQEAYCSTLCTSLRLSTRGVEWDHRRGVGNGTAGGL